MRSVPVAGPARINTAVTEPDGTTTKLNELGSGLSEGEIDAVEQALLETLTLTGVSAEADTHHWAVLSGSLPPGAPPTGTPGSLSLVVVPSGSVTAVLTRGGRGHGHRTRAQDR